MPRVDMICDRGHISPVYGDVQPGDIYQVSSEAKADHHEKLGLGHRDSPKSEPTPAPAAPAKGKAKAADAMAAITGQKK